jgi:hypothetical protein
MGTDLVGRKLCELPCLFRGCVIVFFLLYDLLELSSRRAIKRFGGFFQIKKKNKKKQLLDFLESMESKERENLINLIQLFVIIHKAF